METNLKREADYYTQKGRDTTSHAPNIGVGPWPLPWSQVFFNSTPQYGNLDNPNHNAYAHNWRNKDAAQEPYTVDWTKVPDRYKNTWPNGAYPQYMAETRITRITSQASRAIRTNLTAKALPVRWAANSMPTRTIPTSTSTSIAMTSPPSASTNPYVR